MENKSGVVSYKRGKCEKRGKKEKKDIKWTEMGVSVISTEVLCWGWSEIWKGASAGPNIVSLWAALRLTTTNMRWDIKALQTKSNLHFIPRYEGHLESKERFAIKKYLLIIGNKKNMQVLSHTFTYFST